MNEELITEYLDFLGQTLLEVSECGRTGQLIPTESGFRRVGGYKSLFPELTHVNATPGSIRAAIHRKAGRLYETLRQVVEPTALGFIRLLDSDETENYRHQFGYAPHSDLPHDRSV